MLYRCELAGDDDATLTENVPPPENFLGVQVSSVVFSPSHKEILD